MNNDYITAYYICPNTDRFKDRMINIKNELNKLNKINCENSNGLDSNYLDIELLKKNSIISNNLEEINKGNISCLISHLLCWKRIEKSNDKFALVFEDDCSIHKDFENKLIKKIKKLPDNWDMAWLGWNRKHGEVINKYWWKPFNGLKYGFNAGHHCYLIKRTSIHKFFKIFLPIKSNISKDNLLKKNFNNFNAYFSNEKIAFQNNLISSERLK